ncbi:sigma-70 family RNA polymerase sigma factor [Actinosynnema sp. NPDC059797]
MDASSAIEIRFSVERKLFATCSRTRKADERSNRAGCRKGCEQCSSSTDPCVRKVIVNTCATRWRRRRRGEQPTDRLPETGMTAPQAAVDERERLWQALGRLPRRQRVVLVLRFYEDLTEARAAAALGCSIGTVKSQTGRAIARLRLDDTIAWEEGR